MAERDNSKFKQVAAAGIGVLLLIIVYLIYRTTQAELPAELTPTSDSLKLSENAGDERARAWLEKATPGQGSEPQYAEGEVEPAMRGVQLIPQTMGQGSREEEDKPEVLPEALAAVFAAVDAPFRRTFDALESFSVKFTFAMTHQEPTLGVARTAGSVTFTKDIMGNWHAVYDVSTDSKSSSFNRPLYRSQFWLINNEAFVKRPDAQATRVTQNSPAEDQELLNSVSSGSMDLLSHELLRRWVKEAKFGVGYESLGTDRWDGRPVDVYGVIPPHYGDNPGFAVKTRQGYIWIDRELNIPLRTDLSYTATLAIPQGPMRTYDSSNHITMEITQIGTAPNVEAPRVKD